MITIKFCQAIKQEIIDNRSFLQRLRSFFSPTAPNPKRDTLIHLVVQGNANIQAGDLISVHIINNYEFEAVEVTVNNSGNTVVLAKAHLTDIEIEAVNSKGTPFHASISYVTPA